MLHEDIYQTFIRGKATGSGVGCNLNPGENNEWWDGHPFSGVLRETIMLDRIEFGVQSIEVIMIFRLISIAFAELSTLLNIATLNSANA